MQVKLQDFRWPTNPLIRVMIFNLTARLITQVFPKIDIQARRQRFDQNTPANLLERCIFNIFDFILCLGMGLSFLFIHNFRDRVYYLYEHPDHDDDLCLYPRLTWRHPNTTKWVIYSFPKVKHFWSSCIRFSRDLKSLVPTYKSSPSFFRISPKLAVVIHGAGKRAGELKIIPNGFIRIYYAPTFERGKYHTDSKFEPTLSIDLAVTRAGVDLEPLYKKWGLESIAFIVNNDFRPIFKPVNTRVLSPAAAYALSREFTKPVRVFEPEVSKYTLNKRKLQYPLFVIGFFFISLLGLVCGEPTARVYMCSLYGPRYASIYERLSRWSSGPHNVVKTIFRLLFHIIYRAALFLSACIFLFMQAVVKAIGWVRTTAVAAPRCFIIILESVSMQTLDALGFVFSLQWKTWAIAILACWMLYLEVRQLAIG